MTVGCPGPRHLEALNYIIETTALASGHLPLRDAIGQDRPVVVTSEFPDGGRSVVTYFPPWNKACHDASG